MSLEKIYALSRAANRFVAVKVFFKYPDVFLSHPLYKQSHKARLHTVSKDESRNLFNIFLCT